MYFRLVTLALLTSLATVGRATVAQAQSVSGLDSLSMMPMEEPAEQNVAENATETALLEPSGVLAEDSADALLPVAEAGHTPTVATTQSPDGVVVVDQGGTDETLAGREVASAANSINLDLSLPAQPVSPVLLSDSGPPSFDTILWSPSRPDSHAPIGVMGDHTHEQGEFMFSYRYMFMEMDGNRSGVDSLSTASVLQQFPVTPTRMTMQMHMFGAMYAPTDELTIMAMAPYIIKEMDHATRMGVNFTTRSEGFGDISLSGLYKVIDTNRQRLHLNLGLSFPTGSIEERDATPMGPDQILPYPMQIGSGTFDLRPGVTYLGQAGRWSWGAQAAGVLRLGENSNGYRLGNELGLTAWGARSWTDYLSTSVRLGGRTWGNISGADSRLNPNLIPTADPDLRAGTQLDVGLGVNFYVPEGSLQGARLAVEFNLPLYRSLSGPQLETDYSVTAGLQAVF
ncbi:MAG: transporter [Cyanobacteria bacterium J06628_6]